MGPRLYIFVALVGIPVYISAYIYNYHIQTELMSWLCFVVIGMSSLYIFFNAHKYYVSSCPECGEESPVKTNMLDYPFSNIKCPHCGFKE